MVTSSVIGFPCIGKNREILRALESYFSGKITMLELATESDSVLKSTWTTLKASGIDIIPGRQVSYCDPMLDHVMFFDAGPPRFRQLKDAIHPMDYYFAMARGWQSDGSHISALGRRRWFDTNYHYIVPEISEDVQFDLYLNVITDEAMAAAATQDVTRPNIIGPLTFLYLSEPAEDASPGFRPLSLYRQLLPTYERYLEEIKDADVEWVAIEEPILVLDVAEDLKKEFIEVYTALAAIGPKIMLLTYFGSIGSNISYVAELPIAGLHIDLVQGVDQLDATLAAITPTSIILSLGLVSGRDVWKNEFAHSIELGKKAIDALGQDRVQISTSCSLKHVPLALENETELTEEQRDWFAFAAEKAKEVATITAALSGSPPDWVDAALRENASSITRRRQAMASADLAVQTRLSALSDAQLTRQSNYRQRKEAQMASLNLPRFPTTTLGSYPQTDEMRRAQGKYISGQLPLEEYEIAIRNEIQSIIRFQEKLGLDLLVHGEPERRDVVEYFGERLHGFVCTENGWVQISGTHYARPPIVVSDVSRAKPITVDLISYAQSLTKVPVKGILPGPNTVLYRSFPRIDISRESQAKQIALALRDEVVDLESANIKAIQVDEPGIWEGLPLKTAERDAYLKWAVAAYKLTTVGVKDETQIHCHFCHPDSSDMFASLQGLDADVISVGACGKGSAKIAEAFKAHDYPIHFGPGIYDVHSPHIPTEEEIGERIEAMRAMIPGEQLFVNPDCGLKTGSWSEIEASLKSMIAAARHARAMGS